jgi:hypothetical protein
MLALPKSNRTYFARGLAIGAATAACAVLSMVVSLASLHATLPEDDLARQSSVLEILKDPVVWPFALHIAFGVAAIAYPVAFFLLVRTRLSRSIPVVLVATLVGTALGALSHIQLCFLFGGLLTGIAAMLWCNFRFRELVDQSPDPPARAAEMSADPCDHVLRRWLAIGASSFCCAALSVFVATIVFQATLPREDSAAGLSLSQLLPDPLVYVASIPVAFMAALLGWLMGYALLARTRFRLTIPIAMSLTLMGTAVGSLVNPLVGALSGFIAGSTTMLVCKHLLPSESVTRSEPG